MKLSKQHQLYLGFLSVAVVGLIADRTVLRPNEAVASIDEYAIDPSSEPELDFSPETSALNTPTIARRLQGFRQERALDPLRVNDVFWPAWRQLAAAAPATPVSAEAAAVRNAFAQSHRLNAVLGSTAGRKGYAIVDGKCYRIGDKLDQFTLVNVGNRSATFESGNIQVEMSVQIDGSAPAGPSSPPSIPGSPPKDSPPTDQTPGAATNPAGPAPA